MYYRIYAMTADFLIYESFDCSRWSDRINITLRLNSETEYSETEQTLYPGVTVTWKNVKLTMMLPGHETIKLVDKFITDGERTAYFLEEQMRELYLRCGSRSNASRFRCIFPPEICNCLPKETTLIAIARMVKGP